MENHQIGQFLLNVSNLKNFIHLTKDQTISFPKYSRMQFI